MLILEIEAKCAAVAYPFALQSILQLYSDVRMYEGGMRSTWSSKMKKLRVMHSHSDKPLPLDILKSLVGTSPNANEAEVKTFSFGEFSCSEDIQRAIFHDVFDKWVSAGGLDGLHDPTLAFDKMMKWVRSENRKAKRRA